MANTDQDLSSSDDALAAVVSSMSVPEPPPPPALRTSLLEPDEEVLDAQEQRRRRKQAAARLGRPLALEEQLLHRLQLRFSKNRAKRAVSHQRLLLHKKAVAQLKAQKQSETVIAKEADIFHDILVGTWTRMGFAHAFSRGGRRRVDKVALERCDFNEERIYYKILTTRRTPLHWKNALPYKVNVSDLICEQTLFELSVACQRRVTAFHEDRKGAWIIVDRLEGVAGLPRLVSYRSLIDSYPDWTLPPVKRRPIVCLGVREHRNVEFINLEDHPHILIGGESGGGKSNMVNLFICSYISRLSPETLRIFLVDFKRVEFTAYKDVPHLAASVITEVSELIEILGSLVALINERMQAMEGYARKLSDWNKRYPDRAMPRMLLVIDEFAQVMLGQAKEVTEMAVDLLSQITNLGRAAGVHVMVCTQRPSVQVVPANIKYNMPLRIAGAVSTAMDSTTILGVGDAAYLDDVRGRMVVKTGRHRLVIQTPLVSDDDIQNAVREARKMPEAAPIVLPDPKIPLAYNRLELLRQVADQEGPLGGSLAVSRLVDAFGIEGLTRAGASAFVSWCLNMYEQHGAISVGDDLYAVVRDRNTYRLDPLLPDDVEHTDSDEDNEDDEQDEQDEQDERIVEAKAIWQQIRKRRAEMETGN
jgi:hypothetical protein